MMLIRPTSQSHELSRNLRRTKSGSEMTAPNFRHILKKLSDMDRRELNDRRRQEFSKRSDSILSRFGYEFTRNAIRSSQGGYCQPMPGIFFFKAGQIGVLTELLRQRLPQQAEQIISQAEKVCAYRFNLLGFEDLQYGKPIDWHLDIVHARRSLLKPFHRVDYLNFAEVGDSKITWELNRHQHLVTLAKAYRLTGEQRYAREALSQWRNWHAANPYPRGINWASSLEVAFRSLSWIWTYYLLEGTGALDAGFRAEWLRAQALNGRHLERYLSTYFSPNTHLLGEGVGLFFLGTLCPELAGAERWKTKGWQIVLEEARRQVNPDGLHFEQSTYYHVYALDFLLHAVVLASANGQSVPTELEEILEKMLNALLVLGAAGPPPRFGDDDGGRVFDPSRNRCEHLLDPLALGAVLFQRGDFKSRAGEVSEEAIWLLGLGGVEEWDHIEANAPVPQSRGFENAGLYALATAAGQLVIDGGASVPQSRGHDHADALSVCLQSGGRTLLLDPGTCEYVGPESERNRFRGTAIHNTLCVDGTDQAEPDGPFSWKQNFRSQAEQWISGKTFDFFVGSHDGYARLPSPVLHRRWVIGLRDGIFLVRDVAEGLGEHRLDLSWHLAPDLRVDADCLFRFKDAEEGLAILPVEGHAWSQATHKGRWSPVYGKQSGAMILTFGATLEVPAEFVTLLVPLREAKNIPGTLTLFQHPDTSDGVRVYRYTTTKSESSFFFGRANQCWRSGPVASDAEFVGLVSRGENGPDVVFCNGSYVEIEGVHSLRTKEKVKRAESILGTGGRTLISEPEGLIEAASPRNWSAS